MKPQIAIVESVYAPAMREINALESRIVTAEDEADAMLWDQAAQVVALLKPQGTMSQRELAAQWINVRTGKPYDKSHVGFVKQAYLASKLANPRPRFRDAYNAIANASLTAHVSHNTGNYEWYTPKEYIAAARLVLGEIDLDPASSRDANAVIQARTFYTENEDGLEQPWCGRVWMNPPYAHPAVERFASKLATSVREGSVSAAVVLVNNATETEWFQHLTSVASAVCFPTGRVSFWNPDGVGAQPLQGQAVLYIGDRVGDFCAAFAPFGWLGIKAVVSDAP